MATTAKLVIGVSALMLVGCYSEVPIDSTPTMLVDSKVLGTWWCGSGNDVAQLKIKAEGRFRYAMIWKESKRKQEHYVGFTSLVGGMTVMNLRQAGKVPKGESAWAHPWTFYAIDVSKDVLHLQLVKDKVFSGDERSSPEVRQVLERAVTAGEAFDEDDPCRRSKDSPK